VYSAFLEHAISMNDEEWKKFENIGSQKMDANGMDDWRRTARPSPSAHEKWPPAATQGQKKGEGGLGGEQASIMVQTCSQTPLRFHCGHS
jgi:hypothetical protein